MGWPNNCSAILSACFSGFVGILYYILKSSCDIRFVPFGRIIWFTSYMF